MTFVDFMSVADLQFASSVYVSLQFKVISYFMSVADKQTVSWNQHSNLKKVVEKNESMDTMFLA